MTFQNLLIDVLKFCNIAKIEVLKISSQTDGKARIQTFDPERVLFIDARSNQPYSEIEGEFGLHNFKMLKGLLNLPNFQSDSASFVIGSRKLADGTFPDRFDFKGGGTKATFRLMNKEVIPDQPEINNVPWDVRIVPTSSKLAEFQQMSSLYADVEGMFVIQSEGTNLVVNFGNDSSSTHSGSMVFAENVQGTLAAEMKFQISHFLTLMKLANDASSYELLLTSKGLLGVTAVTNYATYNYYVKKSV